MILKPKLRVLRENIKMITRMNSLILRILPTYKFCAFPENGHTDNDHFSVKILKVRESIIVIIFVIFPLKMTISALRVV